MRKTLRVILLVLLIVITSSSFCFSTILSRNTFEKYEGESWPLPDWSSDTTDSGEVDMKREDEVNDYQTQAHGERSLWLKDPNDTSYASAYKTFTNSASEYMTEFYLWIGNDSVRTAPIDSFPLCVLSNVPSGFGTAHKTDIALVLDTVTTPPDDQIFIIRAQDNNGFHTACYLDTSDIDTWHKVQIYRKPPDAPLPAKVVLYFDGDSITTYSPINSGYVTNKLSLGTTQADSLADGEVFYDDVSIADCTDFEKQIIHPVRYEYYLTGQADEKEMLSFLTEANHYFSRIHPYIIYRNYVYFNPGDLYYVMSLSKLLNSTFSSLTNYERMSYFNELTIKLDQINLGLMYGRLTEKEKKLVKQSLKFVDRTFNKSYNLLTRNTQ